MIAIWVGSRGRGILCLALGWSLSLPSQVFSQEANPGPLLLECRSATPVTATRMDLAFAYLRLQNALAERKLVGEELAQANDEFDAATQAFFLGRNADAIERLDRVHAQLLGRPEDTTLLLACSLRLTLEPQARAEGGLVPPLLRLHSLYWPDLAEFPGKLDLRLKGSGARERTLDFTLMLPAGEPGGLNATWLWPETLAKNESFVLELRTIQGVFLCADRLSFSERSARDWSELVRQAKEQALALEAGAASRERLELAAAWRIFADRAERAALPITRDSTRSLFVDPIEFERALQNEHDALRQGNDPYQAWVGDLWRGIAVGESRVPTRVWVPEHAENERLPLVIAFHGMGAEEDFFFDGAGQILPSAAARERFLLVAPRTYAFTRATTGFDEFLRELLRALPVDPTRIFVLGHSLGAGVVARLQRDRGYRLAAAVCIAGAGELGPRAPVLVLAGARDRIVRLEGLRQNVERAQAAGSRVELEVYPDHGHTLLLSDALPRALEFFGLASGKDRGGSEVKAGAQEQKDE